MKHLREYSELMDAESLSAKLRNKGIMTFVSSPNSIRIPMRHGGASSVGVWAVLPNQYDDAFHYLKNKNHEIRHPLSEEEMEEFEKQNKENNKISFNRKSTNFLNTFFFALLVAFVGFVLFKAISSA